MSAFDKLYRSALPMKFFGRGWGKPDTLLKLIENIKLVCNREKFCRIANQNTPVIMEKRTDHKSSIVLEGSFVSPFDQTLPGIMEPENRVARFQVVLPKEWNTTYKPICLHLAGTGDHTYSRRRIFLANKLLEDGIGSIIVMNPFYWKRKPKDQRGSSLNYVSDLFVMGGALIAECHVLLRWCEENGYGPLGLHGISMGGYMASLCATVWPKPISLVPCLSWTTASVVFVDGIMSAAVDWTTLTKQYFSDSVYATTVRSSIQPSIPPCYRCSHEAPDPFSVSESTDIQSLAVMHDNAERSSRLKGPSSTIAPTVEISTVGHSVAMKSSATPGDCAVEKKSNLQPISELKLNISPSEPPPPNASVTDKNEWVWHYLPFNLSTLMHLNLVESFSSWNLPEALRRPLDASLWHSGMTLIRSLPDNLAANSMSADPEVREFMRELLDYFTHLGNFSPLVDPRLVLAVTAEQDAYVPRQGVVPLNRLYPGSEIRVLPQSGHVGAYLRNTVWTMDFRHAITDCLNRQVELYKGEPGPLGTSKSKNNSNSRPTRSNF